MKKSKRVTAAFIISLLTISTGAAAHGGFRYYGGWRHPGYRIYLGFPYWYPPYYPGIYPYPLFYPPIYKAPPGPPVYVEPGRSPAPNLQDWAYCPSANSYYPHVTVCPEGWQTVRPYPEGETPGYWFYCDDPPGYYPYVRQCYRPWRRINP